MISEEWFFYGIEMSPVDFERKSAGLRSLFNDYFTNHIRAYDGDRGLAAQLSIRFDDVLLCWAYVFFRYGAGYDAYLEPLWIWCFGLRPRLQRSQEEESRLRRLRDCIAFCSGESRNLEAWFYRHCWAVSGGVAEGEPLVGRTSVMSRLLAMAVGDPEALNPDLYQAKNEGFFRRMLMDGHQARLFRFVVEYLCGDVTAESPEYAEFCDRHGVALNIIRESYRRFARGRVFAQTGWYLCPNGRLSEIVLGVSRIVAAQGAPRDFMQAELQICRERSRDVVMRRRLMGARSAYFTYDELRGVLGECSFGVQIRIGETTYPLEERLSLKRISAALLSADQRPLIFNATHAIDGLGCPWINDSASVSGHDVWIVYRGDWRVFEQCPPGYLLLAGDRRVLCRCVSLPDNDVLSWNGGELVRFEASARQTVSVERSPDETCRVRVEGGGWIAFSAGSITLISSDGWMHSEQPGVTVEENRCCVTPVAAMSFETFVVRTAGGRYLHVLYAPESVLNQVHEEPVEGDGWTLEPLEARPHAEIRRRIARDPFARLEIDGRQLLIYCAFTGEPIFWFERDACSYESLSEEEVALPRSFGSYAALQNAYLCAIGLDDQDALGLHICDYNGVERDLRIPLAGRNGYIRLNLYEALRDYAVREVLEGEDVVSWQGRRLFTIERNPTDPLLFMRGEDWFSYLPENQAEMWKLLWLSESALSLDPAAIRLMPCQPGRCLLTPPADFRNGGIYAALVRSTAQIGASPTIFDVASNIQTLHCISFRPALAADNVNGTAGLILGMLDGSPQAAVFENCFVQTRQALHLNAIAREGLSSVWSRCAATVEPQRVLGYLLDQGFNFLAEPAGGVWGDYGSSWMTRVVPDWLACRGVELENGVPGGRNMLSARRPSRELQEAFQMLADNSERPQWRGEGLLSFALVADILNPRRFGPRVMLARRDCENHWANRTAEFRLYDLTRLTYLVQCWPFVDTETVEGSWDRIQHVLDTMMDVGDEALAIFLPEKVSELAAVCRRLFDECDRAYDSTRRDVRTIRRSLTESLRQLVDGLTGNLVDPTMAVLALTSLACRLLAQTGNAALMPLNDQATVLEIVRRAFSLKAAGEGPQACAWRCLQYDCSFFEVVFWLRN